MKELVIGLLMTCLLAGAVIFVLNVQILPAGTTATTNVKTQINTAFQ